MFSWWFDHVQTFTKNDRCCKITLSPFSLSQGVNVEEGDAPFTSLGPTLSLSLEEENRPKILFLVNFTNRYRINSGKMTTSVRNLTNNTITNLAISGGAKNRAVTNPLGSFLFDGETVSSLGLVVMSAVFSSVDASLSEDGVSSLLEVILREDWAKHTVGDCVTHRLLKRGDEAATGTLLILLGVDMKEYALQKTEQYCAMNHTDKKLAAKDRIVNLAIRVVELLSPLWKGLYFLMYSILWIFQLERECI